MLGLPPIFFPYREFRMATTSCSIVFGSGSLDVRDLPFDLAVADVEFACTGDDCWVSCVFSIIVREGVRTRVPILGTGGGVLWMTVLASESEGSLGPGDPGGVEGLGRPGGLGRGPFIKEWSFSSSACLPLIRPVALLCVSCTC